MKNFLKVLPGFLFVSILNVSKHIEGDLKNYLNLYKHAQNSNLFELLFFLGKDPLYTTILYLSSNQLNIGFSFFIFISTLSSYFFFFLGYNELTKIDLIPKKNLIITSYTLIFFPFVFSISGHLLRQFLAMSISFYGICCYLSISTLKTKTLVSSLSSFLIHSSSAIYFFVLTPKVNFKKYFKLLKYIIPIILTLFWLKDLFKSLLSRLKNLNGKISLDPFSPLLWTYIMLFLGIVILLKRRNKNLSQKKISNYIIFLLCLTSTLQLIGYSEVSQRLIMYTYPFFPVLLFKYLDQMVVQKKINTMILILTILLCAYQIITGPWTYF